MRGKRCAALKLLLLPACMLGAGGAVAEDAPASAGLPPTVVILDASKRMGEKVGERSRLAIARDALTKAVTDRTGQTAFGLVALGHRKQSDCKDNEVLAKPGALDGKTAKALLQKVQAKGKAPLAAALDSAAALAGAGKPIDVVLVAGGPDSCNADLCAKAKALKAKSAGLHVHVVGIGASADDLQPLACVAEATGGKFVAAASATAFQQGLDTVFTDITNPISPGETVLEVSPQPAPAAAQAEGQGVAQVPGEVAVLKSAPSMGAAPTPRTTQTVAMPARPVPITFKALITEGGPALRSGLIWRVYNAAALSDGQFELVNTLREAAPVTTLMPGEYLVNAAYGLSNLTKKIKVESGQQAEETFILNTGGLALRAVLATGEECPPDNTQFNIQSDEVDQFGKRETILADAKPRQLIRLNAGAYHIESLYGNANARVGVDITVEPGKVTKATIKHTGAKITFRLVENVGGEALADTKWKILTSAGDEVMSSAGALPTHILAAGNYAVVADHGGQSYSRKFSIEPGRDKQVEVAIANGPTSAEALKILLDPPEAPPPGTGAIAGEGPGGAYGFDGFSARPADPNAPLINPGTLFRPSSP